ncbi:hypothetical protein N2152v2_005115 [Parachlorella kessleri]
MAEPRGARLANDRATFDDALLEVRLLQSELQQHAGAQERQKGAEGPGIPELSKEQQLLDDRQQEERLHSLDIGGTQAGSSNLGRAEAGRALEDRFESGGTQLEGPGAGSELPPLSMWHGVPKAKEGEDGSYVRSVTALEQEFASEENDAA